MADTPKHSVSVAGVVVDDQDRILVIQRRDNGRWEPPGGVLELGETPEGGARREVFEETGVETRIDRLTGVYKNLPRGIIALVFRCTPLTAQATTSDETRAVAWVSIDEIIRYMSPAYAVRILDAMKGEVTAVRTHDGTDLIEPEPEDFDRQTAPINDRTGRA